MQRSTVRLVVPGTLRHRAMAVRVVAEACRLVSGARPTALDAADAYDVRDPFDTAFVSAFMELFNNIAIHAYKRQVGSLDGGGDVELNLIIDSDALELEMCDTGRPFDIDAVPEPRLGDIHDLPEGGMGIHIARTLLDELVYTPGPPNRWRLRKTLRSLAQPVLPQSTTTA